VNLGAKGTCCTYFDNTGHWIEIELVGTKSNRDGIGARVEVYAAAKRQTAEARGRLGYLSQDDGRLHFGLGAATTVDKLIVHWPSGREQTLEKLSVDRGAQGAGANRIGAEMIRRNQIGIRAGVGAMLVPWP